MTSIRPWTRSGRPWRGGCAVLPLLNGLAHLDRLDQRFGAANVMGGTCQINAGLAPDGTVQHWEPLNRILFGERDRSKSARAQAFADALARTSHRRDLVRGHPAGHVGEDRLPLGARGDDLPLPRQRGRDHGDPGGQGDRHALLRGQRRDRAGGRPRARASRCSPGASSGSRVPGRKAPRCCATWRRASPSRRTTSSGTCWHLRAGTGSTTRSSPWP